MADTVVTISGKKVSKSRCRKIGDDYYKIGDNQIKDSGDCYLIDGKYVRINSGYIEFDHMTNEYVRKTKVNLLKGVVDIKNGVLIEGYFSDNPSEVFLIHYSASGTVPCMNEDVIKKLRLTFFSTGGLYTQGARSEHGKMSYSKFNTGLYSVDENSLSFVDKWRYKFKETPFSKLIPYNVGIEYETDSGNVPEHLCVRNGLIPIRDGSIGGYEYATVVIEPEELSMIEAQCEVLSSHCHVKAYCSVHNHMGRYPKNELKVLALYELCRRIQEEVFSFLPPFKKDVRYFVSKKEAKDHCQMLPNLAIQVFQNNEISSEAVSMYFKRLLLFLNEGNTPEKINDIYVHARSGNNKWDYKRRYYWVNFIPLLFERKATVEFRAHHGTLNKHKVLKWLEITNAIMRFADAYPELILKREEKITLMDVIQGYRNNFGAGNVDGSSLADSICRYIKSRQEDFFEYLMQDNVFCDAEFAKDSQFTWETIEEKVTTLNAV